MGYQATNLTLLLLKEQSVFGTVETSLVSTDLVETIGAPKLKWNANAEPINLVAGSFDQDASVPGISTQELSFSVYARVNTADDVGQFGKLLRCSGMTETESPDGTYTYAFTSDLSAATDFTAWLYSGSQEASGSILRKGGNGILIPKFTLEAGKPAMAEFSSTTTFGGVGAAATMPSITKERSVASALCGASTLTINGDTDYKLISCEIDPGQEVGFTKDPSQTYCGGQSVITNRKIAFTAKVYKLLPSVVDPETALLNKTTGAITIEWGTAPQKIKFTGTYAQITDIDHDDEDAVETWTLKGIFQRNDFSIVLTTM